MTALGSNIRIMRAAAHRELSAETRRCNRVPVIRMDAMITARVTDGENPVIIQYPHNTVMMITERIFWCPMAYSGHSARERIIVMIPTCSPLSASMCANPAF